MPQSDRYEDRPPLAEILERFDETEVCRWWPKMSQRERLATVERAGGLLAKWWSRLVASPIPIDDDVPEDAEAENARRTSKKPEVLRWCRRLRNLLADAPPDVWLLAGEKYVAVHAHPPGTKVYDMNSDTEIDRIPTARIMTREWHS